MPALLDVNALISLVDSDHLHHQQMQKWFMSHHGSGWATCPLTENGMVRVLSQQAYPSGQRTPTEVIEILSALKGAFPKSYYFWADDISIADETLFHRELIVGSRQVADVYLLGLVARRKGTLVSFDRRLAWQAVKKGSKSLVECPA